ncbi:hypothetical protein CK203_065265 [Vitis vinifera]|uniref:Uncharacterized protein n=1 Tax=Vitis vinifera TaxID=29760 RepID=A0A438G2H0_VITVI|nr:hypothetical protein CK203_065265 [Vitis vinifera]
MVVRFNATFSGLQKAEKLHNMYAENQHGRAEFQQINLNNGKTSSTLVFKAEMLMQGKDGRYASVFQQHQQRIELFMCSCLGKGIRDIPEITRDPLHRQRWNNMQSVLQCLAAQVRIHFHFGYPLFQRLGVGSSDGLYRCTEHSGGERHFDVDWSPIIEDLKPPGMRGSACVEVMTTLHGSAPSLRRRAEGCVPPRSRGGVLSGSGFYSQSGYSFVDQSRGQISSGFRYTRYGSAGVTVDQFTAAMASIQEALASLGREIGGQQGRPPAQDETPLTHPPPPPPPVPSVHQASPYVLHGHSEIAPPVVAQAVVADDTHARMDRIEQCMRQMRVSDGSVFGMILGHRDEGSWTGRASDDHSFPPISEWGGSALTYRGESSSSEQRTEESVSSFISRWRGKIAEIVDRPSERDQIQMVFEEPTAEDRQTYSSPSDVKGKKPFGTERQMLALSVHPVRGLSDAISDPTVFRASSGIESPLSTRPLDSHATLHSSLRARTFIPDLELSRLCTFALRTQRQFSQIGMPLSQALRKLQRLGPGHETDRCTALRHAIQDLIDQGLVHLGQPSVTTNPLPTHTTHAVPPPAGDPEPIMPAGIYETTRGDSRATDAAPFRLVPEAASVQAPTSEPLTFTRYSVQAPYILIPDVEEVRAPHVDISQTPDVQYILRGGRVVRQPPPAAARPVEGTSASQEEPFSVSSTHRDALTRALSQIRVDTTTTPEGLIHMMTAGRATCIVFSDDDLPPEGSDHTRPLYISVGCSGRRVPSVLLDNGSALNVCPLATAIALGYALLISVPLLRPFALMTAPVERSWVHWRSSC